MSAIAIVLAAMGHHVSGSDLREQPVLDRLRAAGVEVHVGHDRRHVEACDAVTVVDGHPGRATSSARHAREPGHPGAAPGRHAGRDLRPGAHRRRRRHPRQDHHHVDARADPGRGRAAPAFIIGGDVNEIGTGAAVGPSGECSSSRPTRATAPSSSCRRTSPWSPTSSPTTSTTTARSSALRRRLRPVPRRSIAGPTVVVRRRRRRCRDLGRTRHGAAHLRAARRRPTTRIVDVDGPSGGSFALRRRARRRRGSGRIGRAPCPACTTPATPPPRWPWRSSSARRSTPSPRRSPASAAWPAASTSGATATASRSSTTTPTCRAEIAAVLAGGPPQRRRLATRRVAVFQPHRYSRIAELCRRLRRRLRRRRRGRAHRHLPVRHDADPRRHRPARRQRRARRPPALPASCGCPGATTWSSFLAGEVGPGDVCISMGCGDVATLPEELLARPGPAAAACP